MRSSHVSPISQFSLQCIRSKERKRSRESKFRFSLCTDSPQHSLIPHFCCFSPLFRLKRMHGICRWLGFLLHVLQPIQSKLHCIMFYRHGGSPSRHEEYLARLLSYYLLIHHFLPLFSRTVMILLRMHCVFS
ncbi:hypothetical protein BO83DRAFT_189381 [Aspergillus eucalypticola CBS 122712]|uniref:Uncharacterized protein n=1 Tax=Aspergillus eucalypticola (strain CBS 122712 / IBT 29274) TaxID=1448314 RepID=A0A317UR90_ASPEC|nr:uncharacterized protein BO83DRAFT_189381 [Aspergillus eucalypticola CBS 122712]PWY62560.1 hypothetical protein BO83DRAFT_189381 [Aspergillus eucalypticola CBS 122712]